MPATSSQRAAVVTTRHPSSDRKPCRYATSSKFDGNYGVLAGLEVLRTLSDAGIVTEKPIAVAIWTNERAASYRYGRVRAFAGVFTSASAQPARRRRSHVWHALLRIRYAACARG